MQNKPIYAIDLDGTFFNDNREVTPASKATIESLITQGENIVFATSRAFYSVKKAMPWFTYDIPIITSSGAYIMNNKTGEVIIEFGLTDNDIKSTQEELKAFYDDNTSFIQTSNGDRMIWNSIMRPPALVKQMMDNGGKETIGTANQDFFSGNISKIYLNDNKPKRLKKLHNKLKQNPALHTIFDVSSVTSDWYMMIYSANAGKGNALLQVKEMLKANRIICFGNDKNDIEMFAVADEKYAVAEAQDELKEMATAIIGSNNEDGVANWLKQNIKIHNKGEVKMQENIKSKNYLVVVDCQKGFTTLANELPSVQGKEVMANVAKKIQAAHAAGWRVVLTRDWHDAETYMQSEEGKHLPILHCVADTEGAEFDPEISAVLKSDDLIISKESLGSYELPMILQEDAKRFDSSIESIQFCGLYAEHCVLANAIIAQHALRNVPIIIDTSCTAALSREGHDATIAMMERHFIDRAEMFPTLKRMDQTQAQYEKMQQFSVRAQKLGSLTGSSPSPSNLQGTSTPQTNL